MNHLLNLITGRKRALTRRIRVNMLVTFINPIFYRRLVRKSGFNIVGGTIDKDRNRQGEAFAHESLYV